MGLVKDLIGKKFGRLTVLSQVKKRSKDRAVYWICSCSCGKKSVKVTGNHLKSGHTKSCGCLYNPEMNTKHGYNRRGNVKPEYTIWNSMKYRCYNKKYKEYDLYGGRGIKVCKSWLDSFENFIRDMGDRPSGKHSIERINTNGNYEPSNCKWATSKEQAKNRRSNRWIEYNGKKMILKEWADHLEMTPSQIIYRFNKGMDFRDIYREYLSKPKKRDNFMDMVIQNL